MKFNATFALIVICGLVACSQALPAKKRLAYYQQPAAAQYYAAPQRMMFMRYVQPSFGTARSHQAAAALVAGDSVATGTYLQDCVHTGAADGVVAAAGPAETVGFSGEVQDDAIAAAGTHVAHSVAEAYPGAVAAAEEQHKVTVQVDLDPAVSAEVSDDDAKEGREYNYDVPAVAAGGADVEVNLAGEAATVAEVESPAAADAGTATVSVGFSGVAESEAPAVGSAVASKGIDVNVNLPAPAPLAPVVPVKPAKRYLPANKKKVIVELEQAADAEDDADNAVAVQDDEDVEEDDAYVPVPVAPKVPARRPVARKPAKAAAKPLPAGTFFPVDFGGATGGAIAIANSFSTGEGGAATSHAIAYGNPEQARTHVRPVRRH
ncbi:skin secretory protein xP2 isoform X1 [Bactrocera neohumeralis]|uniref:skin secretory protein xP2 isoform X1 n=1 Tax=Bactrocera neohumeralis TaxID=98809 RepID=UPI002166681F|nr:skin secretory protein xP2 isoform X1 [Bactrocera neohumeralis]